MRNEKLEMRKWKRKWKWSSLLLVDNMPIDAIGLFMVYQNISFVKIQMSCSYYKI